MGRHGKVVADGFGDRLPIMVLERVAKIAMQHNARDVPPELHRGGLIQAVLMAHTGLRRQRRLFARDDVYGVGRRQAGRPEHDSQHDKQGGNRQPDTF